MMQKPAYCACSAESVSSLACKGRCPFAGCHCRAIRCVTDTGGIISDTLTVEDHMKRSYSILLLICMALALFVAACGSSSGGGSNSSNQPETVTIWHGWGGTYVQPKQAIFNAYMKLHPNVTIKLVQITQNLIQKATTAIRANNGPDILAWVDDSLGELVDSHSLIQADQYISQSYVNSTYTPAAAQAVQFNGHVWGVPETVEAVTIMYNKKLINASQLPTTMPTGSTASAATT